TDDVMNISRALQGFGAALIKPSALTIVMTLFVHDEKELNKALGFWGASAAAGGSAGVFLGGVITQWLDWPWIFFIYVPLGLIVLCYSPMLIRKSEKRSGGVDILGALSVTGSIMLAVYAIVQAEHIGWGSMQTIGLLIGALVLLVLFLIIQKVRKEPLVPLRIFSAPNLFVGNVVTALLAGAWIPLWYFLNLYLQQVLQFSALAGGLALLPMTLAIMVLMVGFAGKLIGKFGFKPNLVVGMLALGAALFWFALVPTDGSFLRDVLPASLLAAVGMALSYIPATIASMSGAKPEETGLASGIVNTSYQIGSALGLAAMVAVSSAWTKGQLSLGAPHIVSLNSGFQAAFIWAGVIAIVGALIALIGLRQSKG
ncbi:MAG: MFS transporter, partial [Clostridia bacterium]